jgi:short-subunit dehydrogenase
MTPVPSASNPPTAIVTGASSGLGRCIVLELARRGWRTVVIARRAEVLEALTADVCNGAECLPLSIDLQETHAIGPCVSRFLQEHAIAPAALFNNAGFGFYGEFLSQPAELHERLWRVNYLAAVEMTRAVLPGMLERRRGHIINTCSMSTKVGPWGHAGYAASKAALVNVTQGLAAEYPARSTGIHFSVVNPGIVSTPYFAGDSFQPLWPRVKGRAIPPELVSRKMVDLLDRPRVQLCVPWFYRFIDVIDALSPALAQRIVAAESRPG